MKFLSLEHQKQFDTLRNELPERKQNDIERLSVVYLMAGNKELERKMKPYIDWNSGFYFDDMFQKEDFSSGLYVLAKLAVVFYNNGVDLNFSDVFSNLDEKNLELSLAAAGFRYNRNKRIYGVEDDGNFFLR